MSERMRALRMMFQAAQSVKCHNCQLELKWESLPRLVRMGCPACHTTLWDYDFPDSATAARIAQVLHVQLPVPTNG